jgi:serralysin
MAYFRTDSAFQGTTGIDGPVAQSPATGWTLDQIIAQLDRGDYRWNNPHNITFSFPANRPGDYPNSGDYAGFSPFTAAQRAAAILALQQWADVANITFTQVSGSSGAIRFSNSNTIDSSLLGFAFLPGSGEGGDVWINRSQIYATNPHPGDCAFYTFLHEIGHAIGQLHPGNYNEAGASYQTDAVYAEDTIRFTLMSYFAENNGAWSGTNFGGSMPATPMLHDIAAIQAKYGANMTTRTGDTIYGFNSNAGSPVFDFTVNTKPVLCIWDAGGNDTLDLSGQSGYAQINLNEGAFSDICGLTGNLSIAYGAHIENVVGSSGRTSIVGNELDNIIDPGDTLGQDGIDGGAGYDTVTFAGYSTGVQYGNGWGGFSNVEHIIGTAFDDYLDSNYGPACLYEGGKGDDRLISGYGDDVLNGGPGNDTALVYEYWTDPFHPPPGDMTVDLRITGPQNTHGAGVDTFVSIENVTGVVGTLIGNRHANILNGHGTIYGLGGNDELGAGSVESMSAVTSANNEVDQFFYGGSGRDVLRGFSGDHNTLFGGTGNDTLIGAYQEGPLETPYGFNKFVGGPGADLIVNGDSNNVVVYHHASESTGPNYDTIRFEYNGSEDPDNKFDLDTEITGYDGDVSGTLSTATFNVDLAAAVDPKLNPQHAILFQPTSGTLSGQQLFFLVVDLNGEAGYQPGKDLVVCVTGPREHGWVFTTDDFI